jgi:hypothetical protein
LTVPNSSDVISQLQTLADFPGIDGCALVETDTGMAWHVAGHYPELERIGEAAIEFWRIQHRLSAHLTTLGPLKSAAYSFSNRVVALFPCCDEPGLVLVCVAAKGPVAWPAWGQRVEAFRQVVAQSLAS